MGYSRLLWGFVVPLIAWIVTLVPKLPKSRPSFQPQIDRVQNRGISLWTVISDSENIAE